MSRTIVAGCVFLIAAGCGGEAPRARAEATDARTAPAEAVAEEPSHGGAGVLPVQLAPAQTRVASADLSELTAGERRTIQVFRDASQSVVFVTNLGLRRDRFSRVTTKVPQGTGTGFVWDSAGHIVTNHHVVRGGRGTTYKVTLADGSEHEARLVGVAPHKDLAVIKIDAESASLAPVRVGTSGNLIVGQSVLAIGNPFGLDHTLTTGVVSALGRELDAEGGRTIEDVIQTDAAINPGNSGGPLLDSAGRLVGVNTAIYSPSGASAGIGFAIPVDTVNDMVPQMIEFGQPIQPALGIDLVDDRQVRRSGIRGVVIRSVGSGTPAAEAGLSGLGRDRNGNLIVGDVILAVNGADVATRGDLQDELEKVGVGGEARLTVERKGKRVDVPVTLTSLQALQGEQR